MSQHQELRNKIDALIAQGSWSAAQCCLARLWQQDSSTATAAYVLSRYERFASSRRASCRLAILRSFTVEPLVSVLRAAAAVEDIDLVVHLGQFNAYAQELLQENSPLYAFQPDVVLLAAQLRDIAPDLWEDYSDLTQEQIQVAVDRVADSITEYARALRQRSSATLIIHSMERPVASQGILDTTASFGQGAAVEQINERLREICRQNTGVYLLDYGALVTRHGRTQWHDERKWLTTRMPFSAASITPMVQEWLKFLYPIWGLSCKVLAVDLDQTLWGGVLGEHGFEGIQVDKEYPGAAFRELQRALLDLHRRGILLAACSKNNHEDAINVIDTHPGMLLRSQHFSCLRINWQDKATNLREIAAELNVGLDSVAFLDDNPVERERVRCELPQVRVIDLSGNPSSYAQTVRDCPCFERLSLSSEDANRARFYREQQERRSLAQATESLEDFYRSLRQKVTLVRVTPASAGRVAQLTQKTNQFNLTTKRYTQQEIESFCRDSQWNVYSIQVSDRFGDNGIVGVVLTHDIGDVREIDTFLLSCRVIGRTIETAVLASLAEISKGEAITLLQGWFIPTSKNAPVRDFYASHNFQLAGARDGGTLWELPLGTANLLLPSWVRVSLADAERASA